MDIVSIEFLLFCAALLLVYYRMPGKFQWTVLLAASILFYACTGLQNLAYILFTTLTVYGTGLILSRIQAQNDKKTAKKKGKLWLSLCMAANFGLLFVFKVNLLQGGLLPLGISFYIFQSLGYLLDVYRCTQQAQRNLGKFALFVSFFPQLIQGPISKFSKVAPQLTEAHPYDGKQVSFGLQRVLWGFFKKLVIAERIAPAVLFLRGAEYSGLSFFLLSVFYALQIYGDFTGGIDITLGLAEALGIRLPENFCRPFFARNIAEFWRRWHITLGEWMKDYVFYPVSVSKPIRNLSKSARKRWGQFGKRLPIYAASLATWFVTGIWHGLTPNFIIWGMMNCAVIVISEELSPLYEKFHSRFSVKDRPWYAAFEMLRTFLLMNFIRVVDLFPKVGVYFRRVGSLISPGSVSFSQMGLSAIDWLILLGSCIILLTVSILQERKMDIREALWQKNFLLRYSLAFGLLLIVLLMGCYGVGYDAGNFIYSQF